MPHHAPLVTTVAVAFAAAWLFGMLARRLGLAPIVGYLLAGVVIGPYTPGLVADVPLAAQLAEIGVVLLMFGVGLHFRVADLMEVKSIALPGALLQSVAATALGALLVGATAGWTRTGALVFGMTLAVASTVVLLRALEDADLLDTVHGHVAVGWLVAEDVLTVIALVVVPALAGGAAGSSLWSAIGLALAKLAALVVLVLVVGARLVPRLLHYAARLRSRELFTLTVLMLAVSVAAAAAQLFGASMALGAFLAGMMVGQSPLSHHAAAEALPLRDAFGVIFFVSVGMLFDPRFLLSQPLLVAGALAIVLVAKPLVALLLVAALGWTLRTGLVVALGLAQVGEFSFILAELGVASGLMPPEARSLVVASALLSIAVNPFLFAALDPLERMARRSPALWRVLNRRVVRREERVNRDLVAPEGDAAFAVIVGYGPVGRAVVRLLSKSGLRVVVVDQNVDTVTALRSEGHAAVFGDASRADVMAQAGLKSASHLVLTLPHSVNRGPLVAAARALNPRLRILCRARYLRESEELDQAGASAAIFEELEAAVALSRLVLDEVGADPETVERETAAIRQELAP